MRIFEDLPYEIWYIPDTKTIYIYPPIKVRHLGELRVLLNRAKIEVSNIIVGRLYENYL